ncbi:uncharacterized protein K441DRAFT_709289 [Cenococcum geophilum 1.58]|uniref:Uncharacterized protein n=1 Tax=Cenococcum geophilum 1.58 TaxID=794803 RepID=A0ACC8EMN5_9PEZI|nr:hypothetical protein K441DRAFT_709289 [Cenococcum geophilum 1.58]
MPDLSGQKWESYFIVHYLEDFDENISELESQSSSACNCASHASKCECDLDERELTDEDAVDAECYLEYKEMCEDRNRELAKFGQDQERTIGYHKAREDEPEEFGERTNNRQFVGHIYFDANIPPDLEDITVTFINQFLLKMVVPRSIAYPQSPPPNTPKLLEFVGISKHFENEITSQEEKWEREKAEAESWFEMNHPMGSWV